MRTKNLYYSIYSMRGMCNKIKSTKKSDIKKYIHEAWIQVELE